MSCQLDILGTQFILGLTHSSHVIKGFEMKHTHLKSLGLRIKSFRSRKPCIYTLVNPCSTKIRSNYFNNLKAIQRKRADIFFDIIVTLGIMLDWVPGLLGNTQSSTLLSGTKLLVLPFIMIDILRCLPIYFRIGFIRFYIVGFFLGLGGGWMLGNTTPQELSHTTNHFNFSVLS